MGQRTQVLVVKENNTGKRKCNFYHLQWGFGRVMYMTVMDLFMNDYFKETFAKDYNFLNSINPTTNSKLFDCSEEIPKEVYDKIDFSSIETIKNVFEYGDNNNGGIVIYMKENKTSYNGSDFTIGFLLGEDDAYIYKNKVRIEIEKPFSRWLTPEEYGKMNGGSNYSDEKFVKIFTDFCEYFGIEYFTND